MVNYDEQTGGMAPSTPSEPPAEAPESQPMPSEGGDSAPSEQSAA